MALLSAQISVLGWPMLMNRLIPEMLRDKDWSALRGLRDTGDAVVIGCSLLAAGVLLIVSQIEHELGLGFLLAAVLALPFATSILRRQQLAALRRPAIGLLFDQGFGAIIAALFLLVFGASSIVEAVLVFAAGLVLGNLFTFVKVRGLLPRGRHREAQGPFQQVDGARAADARRHVVAAADEQDGRADARTAGRSLRERPLRCGVPHHLPADVPASGDDERDHPDDQRGLRPPAIPQDHPPRARRDGVRRGHRAPGRPAAGAVPRIHRHPSVRRAVRRGGPSLALLAIGQTVNSLAIPLQALLTMGGRERQYGALNMAGLAFHALLNFVLIPPYGAIGAAASTAAVCVLLAIGQMGLNRKFVTGKVE